MPLNNTIPGHHGRIYRDGKIFVVDNVYSASTAKKPGVEVVKTGEAESTWFCRSTFRNVEIHLSRERKKFLSSYWLTPKEVKRRRFPLVGSTEVLMGWNGFSLIGKDRLTEWQIVEGAYEQAAKDLIYQQLSYFKERLPDIGIWIAHGSSNVGIDWSVRQVAEMLHLKQLGVSCPRYLVYIKDEPVDFPILVAPTGKTYNKWFVDAIQVLFGINGGPISYEHDWRFLFEEKKDFFPINLLGAISPNGGPSGFDENGNVIDAAAAFMERVHMPQFQRLGSTEAYQSWVDFTKQETVRTFAPILRPDIVFDVARKVK